MIEDQLRASFAARADDPAETSDLTDRVIGRATAIRRRRTVVGAALGSVTAAIVGFVALVPTTHTASDVPVATPRPASVAYGAHHVVLSDGTERKLTDATIEDVRAVAGGWIVTTDKSVTYVPHTGAPTDLGPVPATVAIKPAGTRVSVQTWGDDSRVEVFTLPALERIGLIVANPDWVATRWMGDHLVITAPNGDAGPVPAALWDPTTDPPALRGEMLVLGTTDQYLIAHVAQGTETCLVRMRPDFTETARTCDTGFRLGDPLPTLSPDGTHLLGTHDDTPVSLDLADAFAGSPTRVPLGLPATATYSRVAWLSPTTALFQQDNAPLTLLQCSMTGTPCTPYTPPTVDNAPAKGVIPTYPNLDTGRFTPTS